MGGNFMLYIHKSRVTKSLGSVKYALCSTGVFFCSFLRSQKRIINPQDSGFRRTLVRGLPLRGMDASNQKPAPK